MKHSSLLDETVCRILSEYRRIAVVGLSDKPWRDSYSVAGYLLRQGYEIIPVNPEINEVLGRKAFPDLPSVPHPVEVVNVFRRLEHIPGIVEGAVEVGAKALWTQYGLSDAISGDRARRAGLLVVMDRCIMVEHRRHFR
jgi:hypothetical protein